MDRLWILRRQDLTFNLDLLYKIHVGSTHLLKNTPLLTPELFIHRTFSAGKVKVNGSDYKKNFI